VDGDHFDPHGFCVGAAATVAAGFVGAALAAGNNVAEVMANYRAEEGWDRINETMRGLLEENAELQLRLTGYAKACDTIAAQYKVMVDLAVCQAEKLATLRKRGVVIE
jgi:hypothetical protein